MPLDIKGQSFRICIYHRLLKSRTYLTFGETLNSTWEWGNPIDKAPQTNPDSRHRSEPALELNSRAASSVGITSPFQQSQHREQFRRKADKKKILIIIYYSLWVKRERFCSNTDSKSSNYYFIKHHRNIQINK